MDAYAPEAAVLPLDVLGKGQAILPRIFQQELAELLLRNRRQLIPPVRLLNFRK